MEQKPEPIELKCPKCGYKNAIRWRIRKEEYHCDRCDHTWKKEQ